MPKTNDNRPLFNNSHLSTNDSQLTTIDSYLKEHENKDMLRFITCGSVDDGKSTLIGRMLNWKLDFMTQR